MDEGMMNVLWGLLLLLSAALIGAWAVFYTMKSAGVYRLCKRRGIARPYLAWLPVVRLWMLGSLADQYSYLTRGKHRNTRLFLLLFGICNFFFWVLCGTMMPVWIGNQTPLGEIFGAVALFLGFPLGFLALRWVSKYRLFRSCVGKNAPMYFTLSVLIPGAESALLLWCCSRDEGMPPRKEQNEA